MKKIGLGLVIAIALLLAFIATRPATLHVERSQQIAAPPEDVFRLVNDLSQWSRWSPWEKKDPAMKKQLSAATIGKGATYSWSGNDQVGAGQMTIIESVPASRVVMKLEFLKPFEATNQATFTLTPAAGGTKVTWANDGKNDFIGKAVSLFIDFDALIGADFETGLASLKAEAERG